MSAPRSPLFSSSAMPLIVVPAGEATLSFSTPGCVMLPSGDASKICKYESVCEKRHRCHHDTITGRSYSIFYTSSNMQRQHAASKCTINAMETQTSHSNMPPTILMQRSASVQPQRCRRLQAHNFGQGSTSTPRRTAVSISVREAARKERNTTPAGPTVQPILLVHMYVSGTHIALMTLHV